MLTDPLVTCLLVRPESSRLPAGSGPYTPPATCSCAPCHPVTCPARSAVASGAGGGAGCHHEATRERPGNPAARLLPAAAHPGPRWARRPGRHASPHLTPTVASGSHSLEAVPCPAQPTPSRDDRLGTAQGRPLTCFVALDKPSPIRWFASMTRGAGYAGSHDPPAGWVASQG